MAIAANDPGYVAAKAGLVALMANGASPIECAAFVVSNKFNVALSHLIEGEAYPDTFAASIFDALCNWEG